MLKCVVLLNHSGGSSDTHCQDADDRSNFADTVLRRWSEVTVKTRFYNYLLSLFTIAVFASACVQSALAQWPTDFVDDSDFYVELGAKFLNRPGDDLGLPLLSDSVTNEVFISSGEITDLGTNAGAEVRFGKRGRHGRRWEIRTTVANWDAQNSVAGANLTSPLTPGFSPDSVETDYDSRLFSVELSFKRSVRPGVVLFAGPRFISLREDFEFTSESFVPAPPFGLFEVDTFNSIETRNNLYGFQVGGEFNLPVSRSFYINSFIRAGGFSNPTRFRSVASTTVAAEVQNELTKNTGSFVGEVGGRVLFDIVPGCVSTHIGYEATWLDGIALAPTQFNTNTTGEVVTANTPFFQGITFGIGFRR